MDCWSGYIIGAVFQKQSTPPLLWPIMQKYGLYGKYVILYERGRASPTINGTCPHAVKTLGKFDCHVFKGTAALPGADYATTVCWHSFLRDPDTPRHDIHTGRKGRMGPFQWYHALSCKPKWCLQKCQLKWVCKSGVFFLNMQLLFLTVISPWTGNAQTWYTYWRKG